MKKKKHIVLKIFIAVMVLTAIYIVIFSYPKIIEGKVFHITDVETMRELGFHMPIESVDCYYSIQKYSIFPDEGLAPISGRIIVTDEYYKMIMNKYDDWETMKGWPQKAIKRYYEEGISEYACDSFKDFLNTETYFFSENYSLDEGMFAVVETDTPCIYFYFS